MLDIALFMTHWLQIKLHEIKLLSLHKTLLFAAPDKLHLPPTFGDSPRSLWRL